MILKPYYETKLGKLYYGDCLEVLPQIQEKANLVLIDPPYGINMDKGIGGFGGFGKPIQRKKYSDNWDKKRPEKEIFDLITKNNCIIFGGNYFTDYLQQGNHWICWNKNNTMPTMSDAELAYTNIKRNSVKIYTWTYNGVITQTQDDKDRLHPTQKPLGLFKLILQDYSKKNDLILDPFSGSGTTAVACEDLKRQWICIEKEEKYCEISAKRIDEFIAQGVLF